LAGSVGGPSWGLREAAERQKIARHLSRRVDAAKLQPFAAFQAPDEVGIHLEIRHAAVRVADEIAPVAGSFTVDQHLHARHQPQAERKGDAQQLLLLTGLFDQCCTGNEGTCLQSCLPDGQAYRPRLRVIAVLAAELGPGRVNERRLLGCRGARRRPLRFRLNRAGAELFRRRLLDLRRRGGVQREQQHD